jgi:hypothetical protein
MESTLLIPFMRRQVLRDLAHPDLGPILDLGEPPFEFVVVPLPSIGGERLCLIHELCRLVDPGAQFDGLMRRSGMLGLDRCPDGQDEAPATGRLTPNSH